MDRSERMLETFGIDGFEETPESLGYELSSEFVTQVLVELKDRGMRRKDLAEAMGVTPASLSRMLGTSSNMTMKTVARLAHALGLEVSAPKLNRRATAPSPLDIQTTHNDAKAWRILQGGRSMKELRFASRAHSPAKEG